MNNLYTIDSEIIDMCQLSKDKTYMTPIKSYTEPDNIICAYGTLSPPFLKRQPAFSIKNGFIDDDISKLSNIRNIAHII